MMIWRALAFLHNTEYGEKMINFSKSIRFYAECDINEIKEWLEETKDLTLEENIKYALTRFLTSNLNSANSEVSINPSGYINDEMVKSLKTVLLEVLSDVYEEEILPTKEYITSLAISIRKTS